MACSSLPAFAAASRRFRSRPIACVGTRSSTDRFREYPFAFASRTFSCSPKSLSAHCAARADSSCRPSPAKATDKLSSAASRVFADCPSAANGRTSVTAASHCPPANAFCARPSAPSSARMAAAARNTTAQYHEHHANRQDILEICIGRLLSIADIRLLQQSTDPSTTQAIPTQSAQHLSRKPVPATRLCFDGGGVFWRESTEAEFPIEPFVDDTGNENAFPVRDLGAELLLRGQVISDYRMTPIPGGQEVVLTFDDGRKLTFYEIEDVTKFRLEPAVLP